MGSLSDTSLFDTSLPRFRAELIENGYADHEIRSAIRTGVLTSLGHGVVISSENVGDTDEQRHRALSLAYARRNPPDRALTDASAAAVLGLPVWGLDTSRVAMSVSGRRSRSKSTGATYLVTDRRPRSTTVVDGVLVVSPARVIVDLARRAPREAAVVVGNAALHDKLCTVDDLQNELDLIAGMSGAAAAHRIIAFLNGASESVLESRSLVLFVDAALPMPELQVEFFDQFGNLIARVDFFWREHGVIGLCDGMKKYDGEEGTKRYRTEKEQDDALTELGYRMCHWYWKDLEQPQRRTRLIQRLEKMLSVRSAA